MSLAPRNEIGLNKVQMVAINQIPRLLLAPNPRVAQEAVARVLAREVEVVMVLVVQRDAMGARLTTTVSTRLQTVVLALLCRAPGGGLLLLIPNLHPHLKKPRHRLNRRLLMGRPQLSLLVKIAGQLSLHSGDGMSMGTPSAMHVVRLILAHASSCTSLTKPGLYYKLHGCYRPTTMKKSIIKRRKRVVPALRDQSPTAATHSSNGSSASPEASPAALAHDHHRYMSNEPMDGPRQLPFAPPPVDFTGFHISAAPLHHHALPKLLNPDRLGHSPASQYGRRSVSPNSLPKKRTLAETAAEALPIPTTLESGSNQLPPIMTSLNPSHPGRLSSISSILNQADPRNESPLGRPQPFQPPMQPASHQSQQLPSISSFSDPAAERRAQLEREAEQMREALRAKERELAAMGR